MKNEKTYKLVCRLILLAAIVSVFSSCTTIYNFAIEIREPAQVTFPSDVSRIVLVNNAASPATGDFGTECLINKKEISDLLSIKFDSAIWTSIYALAHQIESEKFFSKVKICAVPARKDNVALEIKPISKQVAQSIFDVADADAIISVDRCLFKYRQEVSQLATGYSAEPYYTFLGTKTTVRLTCSAYIKDRENPLATFSVQDSLFFKSQVDNDSINLYHVVPDLMINEAAGYIGEKVVPYFVPSWKKVDRFLHTSYESRMKEALIYARNSQWMTAESIWLQLYESKRSLKSRAFLASNMAVASEMRDDLDKALEWSQKAEQLFKRDNETKNGNEISNIQSYISSLNARIMNDLLLNRQFGGE